MIAACIALPLGLFMVAGYITYRTRIDGADLEIARTRDIAREHAAKVLETIERSLAEVAEIVRDRSDPDLRAEESVLHDRLERIAHALPQLKSLWIFDSQGNPVASSLVYPVPPDAVTWRDYFSVHRDRDIGTFVGAVLTPRDPSYGASFFSMSRRRPSADGQFAGVIQASIFPEYFVQFYRQIGYEPGSLVMLALTDGLILASNVPFAAGTRLPAGGAVGSRLAASPAVGLFTTRMSLDQMERRIAYEKVDAFPVYVVASLSTAAIVARWMREFAALLAFAVPGTLLLFAMLWLYLRGAKRLYQESTNRERAEAALRQNQRLEALGQLTGGVAHDFNNLLTVIGSSADLLRRGGLSDERRLRYIDAIAQTVTRATKLTGQLLAFARRQPLTLDEFDAGNRVEEMRGMLTTLLGSSVALRIDASPRSCLVETDPSQFETAIINLAANARDAMPDGGVVTISIDRVATMPRPSSEPAGDGYVAVAVADEGCGIPADQIDRVFEPFFTTKGVGHGTGLGLSQVFGFVRQSRGDVVVESVANHGATFTMVLPRVVTAQRPVRLIPVPTLSPVEGIRILLIDDNADVLRATSEALSARGFDVETAESADAVLARADRLEGIDIVLTDVVMPGTSGLDFAREMRRRCPALPVLVATGYSDAVERDGAAGFTVIRKPYAIDMLAARLAEAVSGKAGRDREDMPVG